ncbi:MAG TPA: purine-nucleoside phosphorylase [bacterium]|nr:purine-nucleoside phosphorylase [bacterium]
MSLRDRIGEAVAAVRTHPGGGRFVPEVGIVLGSGLGGLADVVDAEATVSYDAIPHFPVPTAEGHRGRLILGRLEGRRVAALQGRAHLYEGHTAEGVTFPVRVLHALGVHTLIVTNAAGGLNPSFRAGDLMLITDHINFTGTNPLVGPNDAALGPRFPDMSRAYHPALRESAVAGARAEQVTLREGVYVGVLGPSYETPAEVEMLARWGADAVGMSTVAEVIVARHIGLRVLGLAAITNALARGGASAGPVTHAEVLAVAGELGPRFVRLVCRIVRELPGPPAEPRTD